MGYRLVYAQHKLKPFYEQYDGELGTSGAVPLLLVTAFAFAFVFAFVFACSSEAVTVTFSDGSLFVMAPYKPR